MQIMFSAYLSSRALISRLFEPPVTTQTIIYVRAERMRCNNCGINLIANRLEIYVLCSGIKLKNVILKAI